MNQVTTIERPAETAPAPRPQRIEVMDAIPVLDTARFEHMQRIATVMATSSLIPETLYTRGSGDKKEFLTVQEVTANCFLIVNQAVRWGLDPFAVAQCVSVVHGKLCYEGKLIAAVLEAKMGISLDYEWNDRSGDAMGICISGTLATGEVKSIEGTVGEWKTTGANSPWSKMARKMLAYRGTREWARLYAPATMLGVYSEDEMDTLADDARARRAQPSGTGLAARLQGGQGGFNAAGIETALAAPHEPEERAPEVRVDDSVETNNGDEQAAEDNLMTPAESADACINAINSAHTLGAVQTAFGEGWKVVADKAQRERIKAAYNARKATFYRKPDLDEAKRQGERAAYAGDDRAAPDDVMPEEAEAWLAAYDATVADMDSEGK